MKITPYKSRFNKYSFKEDLPLDLLPSGGFITVKLDITGNGDFKKVQDSFKKDMTVGELIKNLNGRDALKKYFGDRKLDPKMKDKKLGDIAKEDIIELKITKDDIEFSGEKI